MRKSMLKHKRYDFAILIAKRPQLLVNEKKESVLSKQRLRIGTDVGALSLEAKLAQSKVDFMHNMSISLKEANETLYWLDALKDTGYGTEETHLIHYNLNKEFGAMLVSTIKTTKSNNLK